MHLFLDILPAEVGMCFGAHIFLAMKRTFDFVIDLTEEAPAPEAPAPEAGPGNYRFDRSELRKKLRILSEEVGSFVDRYERKLGDRRHLFFSELAGELEEACNEL